MEHKFKWSGIKVVMGLGNPGAEYERTLHNAGAIVLRALARFAGPLRLASSEARAKAPPIRASLAKGGRRAGNARPSIFAAPPRKRFSFLQRGTHIFALPSTFMNESGAAAAEALRYFRVKHEEFLLVHDDADLPLGAFRLGFGRGSAGHHGAQSVIATLHTRNFWRLRVGIRPEMSHPRGREKAGLPAETRRVKAGDFVLRRMNTEEYEVLKETAEAIRRSLLK
ncbi:MAG: aminoacyl-tRNA hydrolase [Candidatus Jorgensenbacteria bacterium]